jgi:hypothetical protein
MAALLRQMVTADSQHMSISMYSHPTRIPTTSDLNKPTYTLRCPYRVDPANLFIYTCLPETTRRMR